MAYRLAIFDLDGTLLNTIADLGTACNAALAEKNLPQHDIESYKAMVGHGMRNLVRNAMPEGLKDDEVLLDSLLESFFGHYLAHIDDFTVPYSGIPELLRKLQEEGVMLAVASNKFQPGTDALIKGKFPEIKFTDILGNRPGAPLKPDPEVVNLILRHTGIPASDAVMAGDSGTDIKTAAAAGIDCIAVSWGFRPRADLADATKVVDTADELLKAILQKTI